MKIHRISAAPEVPMAAALAEFEGRFRYPLGPEAWFRISHGADYPAFFRSMGEAAVYVAEAAGGIAGVLAVVRRELFTADGAVIPAAYLCDAKVAVEHRGGPALARLALRARDDLMAAGIGAAYAVVMDGSPPPDRYTGRLGIPAFRKLGALQILRLPTRQGGGELEPFEVPGGLIRVRGGDPARRSMRVPTLIEVAEARGVLMDTRRGKRLWDQDGAEMVSAHLAGIRADSADGLRELLRAALEAAAAADFPAMFLALPGGPGVAVLPEAATASIYGVGLPDGAWLIDSAEI
jgi:hypothetical protein